MRYWIGGLVNRIDQTMNRGRFITIIKFQDSEDEYSKFDRKSNFDPHGINSQPDFS